MSKRKRDAERRKKEQAKAKKRAAKEARMKTPGGGSKYAAKVRSGRVYEHEGQSDSPPPVRHSFGSSSTDGRYGYGYRHPSAPRISSSWRSSARDRDDSHLPVLRNGEEVYPDRRDHDDEDRDFGSSRRVVEPPPRRRSLLDDDYDYRY